MKAIQLMCPNCGELFIGVSGDKHECKDCGWLEYDQEKNEWRPTDGPVEENGAVAESQVSSKDESDGTEDANGSVQELTERSTETTEPDSSSDQEPGEQSGVPESVPAKKRKLDLLIFNLEI